MDALVLARLDDLVIGMLDRDRAPEPRDLSVQHEPLPAREHALEVGRVEPDRRRVPCLVSQHHGERDAGPAPGRRAHTHDGAGARLRLARRERPERCQPRPILVAERDEEQGVLDGFEVQAAQLPGPAGTHAW